MVSPRESFSNWDRGSQLGCVQLGGSAAVNALGYVFLGISGTKAGDSYIKCQLELLKFGSDAA